MKGQLTIIAILVAFITLFVLAILAPLFVIAVDLIITATPGETATHLAAQSIFLFLIIAVILSVLGYSAWQRYGPTYVP